MFYTAIVMLCAVLSDPLCIQPIVNAKPIPDRSLEACQRELDAVTVAEGFVIMDKMCVKWRVDT